MARVRQQYTLTERDARRFWPKVDRRGPGDCWPWLASRTRNGYGQFHVKLDDGSWSVTVAHRVAYELEVGPIPDGLTLDHLCRNRGCCNPRHADPVTDAVNILRGNGWSGRHARTTHCPQGHPYDEVNTYVWRGMRRCRTCNAASVRRYNQRR